MLPGQNRSALPLPEHTPFAGMAVADWAPVAEQNGAPNRSRQQTGAQPQGLGKSAALINPAEPSVGSGCATTHTDYLVLGEGPGRPVVAQRLPGLSRTQQRPLLLGQSLAQTRQAEWLVLAPVQLQSRSAHWLVSLPDADAGGPSRGPDPTHGRSYVQTNPADAGSLSFVEYAL